jgi:hypothetical protein
MSQHGADRTRSVHHAVEGKTELIPHGIDATVVQSNQRELFSVGCKFVGLTSFDEQAFARRGYVRDISG